MSRGVTPPLFSTVSISNPSDTAPDFQPKSERRQRPYASTYQHRAASGEFQAAETLLAICLSFWNTEPWCFDVPLGKFITWAAALCKSVVRIAIIRWKLLMTLS